MTHLPLTCAAITCRPQTHMVIDELRMSDVALFPEIEKKITSLVVGGLVTEDEEGVFTRTNKGKLLDLEASLSKLAGQALTYHSGHQLTKNITLEPNGD